MGKYIGVVSVLLFGLCILSCSNYNNLSTAEKLIKEKKYKEAEEILDQILAKEADNHKAKLLKVNAVMLQKSDERNKPKEPENSDDKVMETPASSKSDKRSEKPKTATSFSIMSINNEDKHKDADEISKILKNIN